MPEDKKDLIALVDSLLSLEGAKGFTREELFDILEGRDDIILPSYLLEESGEDTKEKAVSMLNFISSLSAPKKMKLAVTGNKAVRAVLLRDRSRQIPLLVLENPQISEEEVAELARSTNADETVLRSIAGSNKWMKHYSIKLAIVSNPKVPLDISIKWAKFLKDNDLKRLSKTKSIPQALATQCLRIISMREA